MRAISSRTFCRSVGSVSSSLSFSRRSIAWVRLRASDSMEARIDSILMSQLVRSSISSKTLATSTTAAGPAAASPAGRDASTVVA